MKTIISTLFAAALCVSSFMAHAVGTSPVTTVSLIQSIDSINEWHVVFPTQTTGSSCATQRDRMRFKSNTTGGKLALAQIMTAIQQSKSIKVIGKGTCTGAIEYGNQVIVYN